LWRHLELQFGLVALRPPEASPADMATLSPLLLLFDRWLERGDAHHGATTGATATTVTGVAVLFRCRLERGAAHPGATTGAGIATAIGASAVTVLFGAGTAIRHRSALFGTIARCAAGNDRNNAKRRPNKQGQRHVPSSQSGLPLVVDCTL
jgi:hypothetical protein